MAPSCRAGIGGDTESTMTANGIDLVSLDASRAAAAAAYAAQASIVRGLRESSQDSGLEFETEKQKLRDLRRDLDSAKKAYEDATGEDEGKFNRVETEGLLKRRFFIVPSFEIYGGVGGLYDYGPPGMFAKFRDHPR